LTHREQLREQADPARGLALRPLQSIVKRGILEMTQIERGGVAYKLLAELVGAKVAKEAFDRRRRLVQRLAGRDDDELQPHQEP